MADQWHFYSDTFGNCNCASNCGCQFNVPSTHGFCQFVEGGTVREGKFNGIDLNGLNWAFMMIWPGEISEGNGRRLIIIDERADAEQRDALEQIIGGSAGAPGSNHFSVFGSTCSEFLETRFLPIEFEIDIGARTAELSIPDVVNAKGEPLIDEFSGDEFHIALARPKGSFEFTYAEIGKGASSVSGDMQMELDSSYAQFCAHNYNQDGLIQAA